MLLQNAVLSVFALLACSNFVLSKIIDVSDENFSKVSKKKSFIMIFATEKDCRECKRLFPRFVSVAQAFEGKDDVLFGKVKDRSLIEAFNITKFPTIVYFEQGNAEPVHYKGDISVDSIFEKMKKEMKKDISLLKRQYTILCTYENFKDIIETPSQFKFLLIFDDESKEEIKMMEDLAKIFKNDDDIIFPLISVKERSVVRNFGAQNFPVLYWYPNVNKAVKKMYGGTFNINELLGFINQHTSIGRQMNGDLRTDSGQIDEFNKFIEDNTFNFQQAASVNMALIQKQAQEIADSIPLFRQRYTDYYMTLINGIAESGNLDETLDNEQTEVETELAKKLRPKRKDFFQRKKNILDKFMSEHSKLLAQIMAGDNPMAMQGIDLPTEEQKQDTKKDKKPKSKDPKKAAKPTKKKADKGDKKPDAKKVEL
ncbi:hypothetical protein ScPMuIL_001339 [Solemya velum]